MQYLWNPYVKSFSTASTGIYLGLVLRSSPFKMGGHHFYSPLVRTGVLWTWATPPFTGHLWPQTSRIASGHILLSLASLANYPSHQPPGQYPLFWAWGYFRPSRGLWPL
ncbi:hypothetical protein O181_025971 [Austropuccinia psidii MF-1]|uniref:Uncharacterized protein n=1 Tax=Austropuccinia psidii MF-1 TaxID=1389203 RepID=A0A9Q3CJL7_9BASI|nr:hypothetical protein [Austropuccinia psidii MF-1]